MADNFQRSGSKSNAQVGRDFEARAKEVLSSCGINVAEDHPVLVGIGADRKNHSFDLGSDTPKIIVECKSHRWTSGNNVPSAKLTVWNEAMYYFYCAPDSYRKIFFVLRDERKSNGETLTSYYLRTYKHMIPIGVEIWEYDEKAGTHEIVYGN